MGDIKQESFEIVSKEIVSKSESWYESKCKSIRKKKRKMFSNLYYHEYKGKQVIGYVCSDEPPQ